MKTLTLRYLIALTLTLLCGFATQAEAGSKPEISEATAVRSGDNAHLRVKWKSKQPVIKVKVLAPGENKAQVYKPSPYTDNRLRGRYYYGDYSFVVGLIGGESKETLVVEAQDVNQRMSRAVRVDIPEIDNAQSFDSSDRLDEHVDPYRESSVEKAEAVHDKFKIPPLILSSDVERFENGNVSVSVKVGGEALSSIKIRILNANGVEVDQDELSAGGIAFSGSSKTFELPTGKYSARIIATSSNGLTSPEKSLSFTVTKSAVVAENDSVNTPNDADSKITGQDDADLGGDDAALGGDDADLGGDDADLGGDDADLGGDDADLGGDDADLGGDDADLGGDDADLGGDDADLGGDDAGLGGDDADLGGDEAGLGGDDADLGGDDAGLGGDDAALGGDDAGLGGDDAALGGDDAGLGGDDADLGGDDAGLGGDDAGLGGDDADLGGDDAGLGGDDADLGGDDAGLGGDDADLGGDDADLGGDDADLGGDDAGLGGDDADLGGDDAGLGGDDADLGGDDAALGGDDAALGGDDAALGGDDAALGGDDADLGGDDADLNDDAGLNDVDSPPTLTVTSRLEGSILKITLDSSDDHGLSKIVVSKIKSGRIIDTDSLPLSGTKRYYKPTEIDLKGKKAGDYRITVVAIDTANNESRQEEIRFHWKGGLKPNEPPRLSLSSRVENDKLYVTISASDDKGLSKLYFKDPKTGERMLAKNLSGPTYNDTLSAGNLSRLSYGTHSFEGILVDTDGKETSAKVSFTRSKPKTNEPPRLSLSSRVENDELYVTISASDDKGLSKLYFKDPKTGKRILARNLSGTRYNKTLPGGNLSRLSYGTHSFEGILVDTDGKETSAKVSFTRAKPKTNEPPRLSLSSRVENDELYVTISASDDKGLSKLYFKDPQTGKRILARNLSGPRYNKTLPGGSISRLSYGSHTFEAIVVDTDGKEDSARTSFSRPRPKVDNPPEVDISASTSGSTATLTVRASDDTKLSKLTLTNLKFKKTVSLTVSGKSYYQKFPVDLNKLPSGANVFVVEAVDSAGHHKTDKTYLRGRKN
nr:hypothetical protein [Maridesulfovibrio sp.]